LHKTSENRNLAALLKANRTKDVGSAAGIWRDMTVAEQEAVLFELLGMVEEEADLSPGPASEPAALEAEETELIPNPVPVPDETELIPKGVEELRGLTASDGDQGEVASAGAPVMPAALTEYQSRWRRRWKWSVAVAAWAVTTIFAFTGDVSSFGPNEWVVTILATVVGGGLLVGTLLNFAVAAIPTREP
jgi:hypothetical protein